MQLIGNSEAVKSSHSNTTALVHDLEGSFGNNIKNNTDKPMNENENASEDVHKSIISQEQLHNTLSTPFEIILSPFEAELDKSIATEVISLYDEEVISHLIQQRWARKAKTDGFDVSITLTSKILKQRVVDAIISTNQTVSHNDTRAQWESFRRLNHFPRHQKQLLIEAEQMAYFLFTRIDGLAWACDNSSKADCLSLTPSEKNLDRAIADSFSVVCDVKLSVSVDKQDVLSQIQFSRFVNDTSEISPGMNSPNTAIRYEQNSPSWMLLSVIFGLAGLLILLFLQSFASCLPCRRCQRSINTVGLEVNDDPDYDARNIRVERRAENVKRATRILEEYNRELAIYKESLSRLGNVEEDGEIPHQDAMELNQQYAKVTMLYRKAALVWRNVNHAFQSQVCQVDPDSERQLTVLSPTLTHESFDGTSLSKTASAISGGEHTRRWSSCV